MESHRQLRASTFNNMPKQTDGKGKARIRDPESLQLTWAFLAAIGNVFPLLSVSYRSYKREREREISRSSCGLRRYILGKISHSDPEIGGCFGSMERYSWQKRRRCSPAACLYIGDKFSSFNLLCVLTVQSDGDSKPTKQQYVSFDRTEGVLEGRLSADPALLVNPGVCSSISKGCVRNTGISVCSVGVLKTACLDVVFLGWKEISGK